METPTLYIFSGLPGSGKSTLSQVLAAHLGAAYVRIDTIEQGLRELCSIDVQGEGYRLAYRVAADNLRLGISVVADSCNPIELTRRAWERVAGETGARYVNIEVVCSDRREHRKRVETRTSSIPGLILPTWREVAEREYHDWTVDRMVVDTCGRSERECLEELLAKMSAPNKPRQPTDRMDYNSVAHEYDRRYALHSYPGIRSVLRTLAASDCCRSVLEVGCGTGEWLAELASAGVAVAGVEPAEEMLRRAAARVQGDLRQGVAESLPWPDSSFDAVVFINSLHHSGEPRDAIREAFRVLRAGGTLLSIGLDPHDVQGRWYVYEYFPETIELDRARFASKEVRLHWLVGAGVENVTVCVAERMRAELPFAEAMRDGLLSRSFTSQLTCISDTAYERGMTRLRAAAARDPQLCLCVDLTLFATSGIKPASS